MSPIDVCNQALAHLSDRRITRLDDDAQTSDALVRYCSEFYDISRLQVLAAQRWSFAKKVVELTQRTDQVVLGFKYSHQLPEDHIRLICVHPGYLLKQSGSKPSSNRKKIGRTGSDVDYQAKRLDRFKIMGNQLWTNEEFIAIEYVADINNPSDWTPHFLAAVARLLASYLAGPVADNPNEAQNQKRIYETIDLPNAQFYDAIQDNSGENSNHQLRTEQSLSLRSRRQIRYGQGNSADSIY